MQSRYEQGVVAGYVLNVIKGVARASVVGRTVGQLALDNDWIEPTLVEEEERPLRERHVGRRRRRVIEPRLNALPETMWQQLDKSLHAQRAAARASRPSRFQRHLEALASRFKFDELERRILFLTARYRLAPSVVRELCDALAENCVCDPIEAAARMLGTVPEAIVRRTAPGKRLVESGFLRLEESLIAHEFPLTVPDRLVKACKSPNAGEEAVLAALVGKPCVPALAWEDFDHIGRDRDFVAELLTGAIDRREAGVNILFYGPPGTGKTEFCKTLAARLGLILYAIADDDGRGDEPTRGERISQLRLSQNLLAREPRAALLFDEAEDLLDSSSALFSLRGSRHSAMGGSKTFTNRLMEQNRIPTFWTSNNIDFFDPAFLRRMTLAIEIRKPNAPVRERLWHKVLAEHRIAAEPAEIRRLAREFEAAPAIAASAARAARLCGGGIDKVRQAVRATEKAMRGGIEPPPLAVHEAKYDPRLAVADLDLAPLADRLCAPGTARNFSLCLFGPPGTGKSAFARYLADRLGMEVLHKGASDLLSMWVGGTEQNIAAAFAEARDAKAFLIIDEADSLLQDRSGAIRSWEVTQVNEMLTWMECHDQPVAFTSNLMDSIDRAALRRFTFKVKFGYLGRAQIAAAFEAFFGLEAPREALAFEVLTPGDFAVVARRARLLGASRDAAALARMLADECSVKPDRPRPIGFAA